MPPAVDPARRLALLARLILQLPADRGGVGSADRAWLLAAELATLMDEAERMEIDLPDALANAAAAEHAEHWRVTLDFLAIVTRAWPQWLDDNGMANPAARQVRLIRAQARAWQDSPPRAAPTPAAVWRNILVQGSWAVSMRRDERASMRAATVTPQAEVNRSQISRAALSLARVAK